MGTESLLVLCSISASAPRAGIEVALIILDSDTQAELHRTAMVVSDADSDDAPGCGDEDGVSLGADVRAVRIVVADLSTGDVIGEGELSLDNKCSNAGDVCRIQLTAVGSDEAATDNFTLQFSLCEECSRPADGQLVVLGAAIQPINVVRSEDSALVVLDEANAAHGFALVEVANKRLGAGLHKCGDWEDVKDTYFEAGARLAQAGLHKEAGTAFQHAAGICRFLGTEYEVANAVGYAVDSCRFVDPLDTISMLREQSETYAKCALFLQAAKCEKDSAEIQERLGNNEEAFQHYDRAVGFYGKDARSEKQRQLCEAKVRHLTCALGRFGDAAALFEAYAENHVPGIPPTTALLFAVLSHLAAASGDLYAVGVPRALRKFGEFQSQDDNLRKGKEFELLTSVFTAFDKGSLSTFDAAVRRYRSASHKEALATLDLLVTKCRDNLYQVLLPYMN